MIIKTKTFQSVSQKNKHLRCKKSAYLAESKEFSMSQELEKSRRIFGKTQSRPRNLFDKTTDANWKGPWHN